MRHWFPLLLLLSGCLLHAQERPVTADSSAFARPDTTLCFAQRDTCDLLLDFYAADPAAGPCADSLRKPVIIHVFGGAFLTGRRNHPDDLAWYRQLADAGYHVAAIDYRLGMKGVKVKFGMSAVRAFEAAIQIAVDDLYAATNYLLDHAEELSIDPDRIIVSGSSAGAITALQAEWQITGGKAPARALPGWFNYAGIMAFAGAVLSTDGAVGYPQKPCPALLMHGTADRIVNYRQISIPGIQLAGSDVLAAKMRAAGANVQIYRYKDVGHEVAASMARNLPEELRFLEENVIKGIYRPIDATIEDALLPDKGWKRFSFVNLY